VIVYAQSENIRAIRIDGTGQRQIAGVMTEGSETPCVSPDGTEVAFASSDIAGEGVRVTSFAGNIEDPAHDPSVRRVTASTGRNPAWSADGYIAYETALSWATRATIAIVPAAGGAPHDVTSAGFDDRNPSWAPAGFAAQ
jgi:Tol biopolymer transport system component